MIIIETPAPPTRERLVLVPPLAVSRTEGGDALLTIRTANARDATPADMASAGYVLAAQPDPGTLAHLRADLRDMTARAERAERELAEVSRAASGGMTVREAARARCALGGPDAQALEGALSATERELVEARAALARLTAPGDVGLLNSELVEAIRPGQEYTHKGFDVVELRALYRLGVAHERARQQPEKDRATDEELERVGRAALIDSAHRPLAAPWIERREAAFLAGILAVAARVRQERCLVAQAVGLKAGVSFWRCDAGWCVSVQGVFSHSLSPAEVPATLARLLGEVSR